MMSDSIFCVAAKHFQLYDERFISYRTIKREWQEAKLFLHAR